MIADGGGGGGCPQRGRARPAILVLMYGADKKVNNGLTPLPQLYKILIV